MSKNQNTSSDLFSSLTPGLQKHFENFAKMNPMDLNENIQAMVLKFQEMNETQQKNFLNHMKQYEAFDCNHFFSQFINECTSYFQKTQAELINNQKKILDQTVSPEHAHIKDNYLRLNENLLSIQNSMAKLTQDYFNEIVQLQQKSLNSLNVFNDSLSSEIKSKSKTNKP